MKNRVAKRGRQGVLGWLVIIGFSSFLLYHSVIATYNSETLSKSGIAATAVVVDVRRVGGKGIRRCTYSFEIDNAVHTGKIDDDTLDLGDSVRILYIPKNPEVNKALSDLK
jgi:hypothetical protein